MKKASQVYEEYRYLVADFGVDHISDFSDSWISTPFLRDLVGEYERRGSIPASLRVYGDPRLVTADNARLLRQLGVHTVLLGIESGDERVLHMNGKRMSPATILAAVHALASNNIQVADAYVLGLIGETRESVQKTIELARTLRNACDTEISYWNIMTPLPGSHVWRSLCARGLVDDSDYHLIPDHLERLSTRYLTHLGDGGYEHLIGVREEMLASSKVSSAEFVPRMAELAVPPISRHIGKSNGEQCVLPSSVNRRISHEDR
jgi:radical SAM superfamily enzyme YgiQ (UPF0313 family)